MVRLTLISSHSKYSSFVPKQKLTFTQQIMIGGGGAAVYSCNRYLLRACCVPGTVLGTEDATNEQAVQVPGIMKLIF